MAGILAAHGDVVVAESGQIAGPQQDTRAAPACVSVEVNGQRAPALDCISDRLAQAVRGRGGAAQPSLAEQAAGRPSNQLGMFNHAATANRMGNTFGTSVNAQRPPPPPAFMPALGPRR